MSKVDSSFEQLRIFFDLVSWYAVMFGIPKHTNIEVRVAKPVDGISDVSDSPLDYLSVKVVRQRTQHLTF